MSKVKALFKHKGKIIIVLIIIAAAAGGWRYYDKFKKNASKDISAEFTETVKKGDISIDITKDGAFQPKESVEVSSRADGKIKELFVKEGDTVKTGQKLLVVQPGQSVHDKFLPVDVAAPMSGLVLRCLNERMSRQSTTKFALPSIGESITGSANSGSATCILKIIKPGKYVIPIKIGEYDIGQVKLGMPVKISVLSRPGVSYDGFVSAISPQPEINEEKYWDPDSNKVEFITVIETKGNIKEILIGLSASIKIDVDSRKDVILIPSSAIFEEKEKETGKINFFVYRKEGNKKAKKIKVELGLKNDTEAELTNTQASGLKEGDTLLLDIEDKKLEII